MLEYVHRRGEMSKFEPVDAFDPGMHNLICTSIAKSVDPSDICRQRTRRSGQRTCLSNYAICDGLPIQIPLKLTCIHDPVSRL